MGYGLIFLIILITLAGRHVCSVGPSLRSKRLVVVLTAVLVFALMRWREFSLLTVMLLAAVGIYVILHQFVMSWQREIAEAERAAQQSHHASRSRVTRQS